LFFNAARHFAVTQSGRLGNSLCEIAHTARLTRGMRLREK
jgi:hypothetical protein